MIVSTPEGVAARFAGENEEGEIDRRKLQRFKYADIYTQWIDYWRGQVQTRRFDEIVESKTPNYYVGVGGEVGDTGADAPEVVCNFLFSLLVSDEPKMQAFELAEQAATEQELPTEVSKAFADLALLADAPTLHVRHPIKRFEPIQGAHAIHKPTFSQRNGRNYIYETIDFGIKKPKLIRERSGWMAYMFNDIRQKNPDTEAFSIIRPALDDGGEATEFAKAVLGGDSELIDWRDETQRKKFLNSRQLVAETHRLTTSAHQRRCTATRRRYTI